MQALKNIGRRVGVAIAIALAVVVGCHGTLPEEGFVGPGATLAELAAIIKEIRARTDSSDTIPPIIADLRGGDFDNLVEFEGVGEVDQTSGPDVVAEGPTQTVSGGTVQVNLRSATTAAADRFNFVLVTVAPLEEEDTTPAPLPSPDTAALDGPQRDRAYFVIRLDDPNTTEEESFSDVELFITTRELPEGESTDNDFFGGFQCIYQAGLLEDGSLAIGEADEDSQNPIDVEEICYGQLQITATWNTSSNLDLVITDPDDNTVMIGAPPTNGVIASASISPGGGGCEGETLIYESYCWGAELPGLVTPEPPFGEYTAQILNADSCAPTQFTLTVLVAGEDGEGEIFEIFTGLLDDEAVGSDTYTFQFPSEADVEITKQTVESATVVDGEAEEGSQVVFDLTVSNELDSPNRATGVQVVDELPEGLAYAGHILGGSPGEVEVEEGETDRIVWTVGSLMPGERFSLLVNTDTEFGTGGQQLVNTATVVADQASVDVDGDDDGDSGSATVTVIDNGFVNLSVEKTADDDTPVELSTVTYTLVVTNDEDGAPATGVRVQESLPEGLTFVSAEPAASYDAESGVWFIGSMAPGERATLELAFTVDFGTAGETLTNSVQVSGDQEEPEELLGDNTADEPVLVAAGDLVDLALDVSADSSTPDELEEVIFSFLVQASELGQTATNVTVDVALPEGLTFSRSEGEFDPESGVWSVGTLEPGGQAAFDLFTVVDFGRAGEFLTVQASASADQTDALTDDNDAASTVEVTDNGFVDLAIFSSVDDDTPEELATVGFTLNVTCSDEGASATGVQVATQLAEGLSIESSSGDGSFDEESGIWNIGGLAAGTSAQRVVNATVGFGTAGETLTLSSEVSASQQDPLDDDNDTQTSVTVEDGGLVDLSVGITPSTTSPDELEVYSYDIVVVNSVEGAAATGVVVSNVVTGDLELVSSDTSQGSYDDESGIWNVGALAPGVSATLSLAVSANFGAAGTNVPVSSSAAADQGDPFPEDNDASNQLTVQDNGWVDLSVASATSGDVYELDNVDIVVNVRNSALGAPATGVFVSGILPDAESANFVSATSPNFEPGKGWFIGDLFPGQSVSLAVTVQAALFSGGTTVPSASEVSGDQVDPLTDDNLAISTFSVLPDADLALSKSASVTEIVPGTPFTWTITVENVFGSTATQVVVSEPLASGLFLTGSQATQGTFDVESGEWSVGNLTPGSSATLTLTTTASSNFVGKGLTNLATVSAAQNDPNPSNDSASDTVLVVEFPELAFTKEASVSTLFEGESLVYTLKASHVAGGTATGVTVFENMPSGFSIDSFTATPGTTFDSGQQVWTIGSLGSGQTVELAITATPGFDTSGFEIQNFANLVFDQGKGEFADVYVNVLEAPDLSVNKYVEGEDFAVPGATVSYTIEAYSSSFDGATGVVVTDVLPDGLSFASSRVTKGDYDSETGTWTIGDLEVFDYGAFLFLEATVDEGVAGGTVLTNTATIRGDQPDPKPDNDTDTADITVAEEVTADFTASPLVGQAPLTVNFTDTSTGPVQDWFWDFGDGQGPTFATNAGTLPSGQFDGGAVSAVTTSTEQNPSFTYSFPGTYTVRLTVSNDELDLSDTLTQPAYITVTSPPDPIAGFTVDPGSGLQPLGVQFNDTSSNADLVQWDFGEGLGFQGGLGSDPAHIYQQAGVFTPRQLVSNAAGSDIFVGDPIVVGFEDPVPPSLGNLQANIVCNPPTSSCNCIGFDGHWYELSFDFTDFNGDYTQGTSTADVFWRTSPLTGYSVITGQVAFQNISGDGFQGSVTLDPCWSEQLSFTDIEVFVRVVDAAEQVADTNTIFLDDHVTEIGARSTGDRVAGAIDE